MTSPLFEKPETGVEVSGRFAGDLSRFSTLDLAQTLMLARKTGLLTVRNGERRGHFFFRNGEIVAVIDDAQRQGMQAALHLFLWKDGAFEFDFDKIPPDGTLGMPTENLLMEAARHIDEVARDEGVSLSESEAQADGSPHGIGEDQLDNIREIFARIVDRTMPATRPKRGRGLDGLIVRMREEEAESLLLVSGHPPRLVAKDRQVALDAAPVLSADVERLIVVSLDPRGRRDLERIGVAEGILETSIGTYLRAVATVQGGLRSLSLHMPRNVVEFPASEVDGQALFDEPSPGGFLAFGDPDRLARDFAASAVLELAATRGVGAAWFASRDCYRFPADKALVLTYPLPLSARTATPLLFAALERGARIIGIAGASPAVAADLMDRAWRAGATTLATLDRADVAAADPAAYRPPVSEPQAYRGAFEVAPAPESPFTALFHAARS